MNDEDDLLGKTSKISIADIKKLQIQTESSTNQPPLEISIAIERDVLNRIEKLLGLLSQTSPTQFNTLTSEIFVEGLKVLENKHK